MENAADALKMAGAVLIFVLALSIIIFAFSQARETADTILTYRDRETMYIESDYYYGSTQSERVVGFETVIPSIFRAYLENYKIVFEGLDTPIYRIQNIKGNEVNKYTLDLEQNLKLTYPNSDVGTNKQKADFIKGILYHDYGNGDENDFVNRFNDKKISLKDCESIYDQLKGKKITEYIGIYYRDDNSNEPEVNKEQKRIITYKVE